MDRTGRIKSESLLHEDVTDKVLDDCFEVALGTGFLESVCQKAL
jgi:hypothetical protein